MGAIKNAIKSAWGWLMAWTQFLDDPRGKFSFKRGMAIASFVTSIILAAHGAWMSSAIYLIAAVLIAIITAITKT